MPAASSCCFLNDRAYVAFRCVNLDDKENGRPSFSASLQLHTQLGGRFVRTHEWPLPQSSKQPTLRRILAHDHVVALCLDGTFFLLNMLTGCGKSYLYELKGPVIHAHLTSSALHAIDETGCLLQALFDSEKLDLVAPLEHIPLLKNKKNKVIDARVMCLARDHIVVAIQTPTHTVVTMHTEGVSRRHQLDSTAPLTDFFCERSDKIFLLTGPVLYQFDHSSFELVQSWIIFDEATITGQLIVRPFLPHKWLVFSLNNSTCECSLLDLTHMQLIPVFHEPHASGPIVDIVVNRSNLTVNILDIDHQASTFYGITESKQWPQPPSFEFTRFFDITQPFVPLSAGKIIKESLSEWADARAFADSCTDLEPLGVLVATRGRFYDQFVRDFGLLGLEKLTVDFEAAVLGGLSIKNILAANVPLNFLDQFDRFNSSQLYEAAEWVFKNSISGESAVSIVAKSTLDSAVKWSYAASTNQVAEIMNQADTESFARFPLPNRKAFWPLVSRLRLIDAKIRLLIRHYFYAEALAVAQDEQRSEIVEEIHRALPRLAPNRRSYPSLPVFEISSPIVPETIGRKSTHKRVSFAVSPSRSPLLALSSPAQEHSAKVVRTATPRHHATIQPSRLNLTTRLAIDESDFEGEPESESPLRTKTSQKTLSAEQAINPPRGSPTHKHAARKSPARSPSKVALKTPTRSTSKKIMSSPEAARRSPRRRIRTLSIPEDSPRLHLPSQSPSPTKLSSPRKQTVKRSIDASSDAEDEEASVPRTPKRARANAHSIDSPVRHSPRLIAKQRK